MPTHTLLVAAVLAGAAGLAAAEPGPMTPFKITYIKKPDKVIEAGADGVVRAKGKVVVKIAGDRIENDKGEWLVMVTPAGEVKSRTRVVEKKEGKVVKESWREHLVGRIDAKDEVVTQENATRLWFDEAGVLMSEVRGKREPQPMLAFSGIDAKNRRAALLLYISMFAAGREEHDLGKAEAAPMPR